MVTSAQNRGEQTRLAILHAAHALFIKQGYHGTSMRQIAKDAGIALGGLYNHFSSKEAVFEAVFLEYHPYHEVFPIILEAQGTNFEQMIQDAIQRMVEAMEGRPDFMNLMFIEMVEFKSAHVQRLFAMLFPQGMQIMLRLVRSFPEQMRPIPPPIFVRTFLGLFFGYYLTELALAPVAPPEFREDALHYFVDVYLHGVMAKTVSDRV